MPFRQLCERALHGLWRGHIALDGQRSRADLLRCHLHLLERAPEQHDLLTIFREAPRKRATQPQPGTRNCDNF